MFEPCHLRSLPSRFDETSSDDLRNDARMPGRATREQLTAREVAGCAALAIALALAMHWPLPLHMGRDIAQDLGDPLVQAWQVAWDGHALKTQPLELFQANMFWPMRDSLAVSDALVGYAPAGLIGEGAYAAVARYDALFLFAFALAFLGAYLLARELGASRAGSLVAGAAFAYAPYRLEQEGHLHIISSGASPLALALLIGGYRRGSPRHGPRRLARRGVAVLARLLARAGAGIHGRRRLPRRRGRLVAARAPAPAALDRGRDSRRAAELRARRRPARAPVHARAARPPRGAAHDLERRRLLGTAV